tara:strand:+ start:14628 stop:14804 length:177 start_codon:yes stop_codon:yes gene_type:complete
MHLLFSFFLLIPENYTPHFLSALSYHYIHGSLTTGDLNTAAPRSIRNVPAINCYYDQF